MTPVELSRTVLRAVRCAVDEGELNVVVPVRAVVTLPGPGGCGDYATNIALQLARPAGRSARQVAEILRPHLTRSDGVADVAITGPGFLNFRLGGGAGAALVREIQLQGDVYGHGDVLAGQIVPLLIPYDIRAEVVADALVRIVAAQGGRAEVQHMHAPRIQPPRIHPPRIHPPHVETPRTEPPHTELTHPEAPQAHPSRPKPTPCAPPPRPKTPPRSVPMPAAGPCCIPRPTTGRGSAPIICFSGRATLSSGSGTRTPAPGPSSVTPPRSAAPATPVTYPASTSSSGPSPGIRPC